MYIMFYMKDTNLHLIISSEFSGVESTVFPVKYGVSQNDAKAR